MVGLLVRQWLLRGWLLNVCVNTVLHADPQVLHPATHTTACFWPWLSHQLMTTSAIAVACRLVVTMLLLLLLLALTLLPGIGTWA